MLFNAVIHAMLYVSKQHVKSTTQHAKEAFRMAQGIILAAGYSSRAKTNKMLLSVDGVPIILYAIRGMMPYVRHIWVVTGHDSQSIIDALEGIDFVTCVNNASYDEGMFSSVLKGLSMVSDDVFILPGDCPFVKEETYAQLLQGRQAIRVPQYRGRKGHPLFIEKALVPKALAMPKGSTLKTFRDQYPMEIIDVDDPHILHDIDTIEAFESVTKMIKKGLKP
jgi:molybdenum cofactor cytidylyltransferase